MPHNQQSIHSYAVAGSNILQRVFLPMVLLVLQDYASL
jgi:hypothetical protein